MGRPLPFPGSVTSSCGTGSGGSGQCTQGAGNGLPQPIGPAPLLWQSVCGCLAGNEPILLFDGSEKAASQIDVGDVLLGIDSDGRAAPQTVTGVLRQVQPCMEVVHECGRFVCSLSHILMDSKGNEVTASGLCEDVHELLAEDGTSRRILNLRRCAGQEVFGWNCEPDHTFVSSGIVHHNKRVSVLIPTPVQAMIL